MAVIPDAHQKIEDRGDWNFGGASFDDICGIEWHREWQKILIERCQELVPAKYCHYCSG